MWGTHTHTPRSQHQQLTWQECQNFGMNLLLTAQNMPFRDRWGRKRDGPSCSPGLGPVRGILGLAEDGDHINVGKMSLEGCSTQGEGCQPDAKPPSIPFLTFFGVDDKTCKGEEGIDAEAPTAFLLVKITLGGPEVLGVKIAFCLPLGQIKYVWDWSGRGWI